MKLLDFFSIKQKLAIFLLFLTCAVSYLAISTIHNTSQTAQTNAEIEIAQQQKLIVEKFINTLFSTKLQTNITGLTLDYSELDKHISLFNKNLKAMLLGGEAYLDLQMQHKIILTPDLNNHIKIEIQKSLKIWEDLQTFSQTLQLQSITKEQLTTIKYLTNNLQKALEEITTILTQQKTQDINNNQLILQISWFLILVIGSLFTWFIAKNITQPLTNITHSNSRIRSGDLQSYPIDKSQRDEVGTLLHEANEIRLIFNNLIIKIQQHNKQINFSTSQLGEFFNEINTIHALQFNQFKNMENQFDNLQKNTEVSFQLLTKNDDFNNSNKEKIESVYQSINSSLNSLESIYNNSHVCNENITNLQKNAKNLYNELSNLEALATNTQSLATKTTLDSASSNKKLTFSCNKIIEASKNITNHINQISPLLTLLQSQVDYLPTPVQKIEVQVSDLQQQLLTINQYLQSLKDKVDEQQDNSNLLTKQNKQQELQIKNLQKTVESAIEITSENKNKSMTNLLFIDELNEISQQIDELSSNFKTEEISNKIERGDDKRSYPRITNQIKVSLQQAEKSIQGITQDISLSGLQMKSLQSAVFRQDIPITFTINLPNKDPKKSAQQATLFCDVVKFERHDDVFYYRISFQTVSPDSKTKIQQIFDYFDKTSEFVL